MRLHTLLTEADIRWALKMVKEKGLVAPDVQFDPIAGYGSRTHPRAFEIQLGAANGGNLPAHYTNQYGKRQKTRRVRNSVNPQLRFAATWHEWGWFIAEVFNTDPTARWGCYDSREDFHDKTGGQFS